MRGVSVLVIFCVALALPLHNAETNPRIVGGRVAKRRYRRQLGLLRTSYERGQVAGCTATVVGSRWLLTAAHCVAGGVIFGPVNVTRSYAIIGESNPLATSVRNDGPVISYEKVFVHNRFRQGTDDFRFDIALIQLAEPIPPKRYYPVAIRSPPSPDTVVKAVGYGVTGEDEGFPKQVQMANVVLKNVKTCARNEQPWIRRYLPAKRMVCAVSLGYPEVGRTDTCYGDSGGPLFFEKSGRIFQFALTSFSTNSCAEQGGRAYYTRLDAYRQLIREKVKHGKDRRAWRQIA